MAKRIQLEPGHEYVFRLMFEGFHSIARPKTREEHKLSNRILDILESVSIADVEPVPGFPDEPENPRRRMLNPDGGTCTFEDQEFAFLKKVLSEIATPPMRSKNVEKMWAVLDNAEQVDLNKKHFVNETTTRPG